MSTNDMTNEELAALIRDGVNVTENMALLWEKVEKFAHWKLRKYTGIGSVEDVKDFEQESFLAMVDATKTYDPEGGKFITYYGYVLKTRMHRYISTYCRCTRIPESVTYLLHQYSLCVDKYKREHGVRPSAEYVMAELDITDVMYRAIIQAKRLIQTRSIYSPVNEAEGDSCLGDFIPGDVDIEGSVLDECEKEELKRIWDVAERELAEREVKILQERFIEKKSVRDVAEELGISHQRVDGLEKRALSKLGQCVEVQELYELSPMDALRMSWGLRPYGSQGSSTERAAIKILEMECW